MVRVEQHSNHSLKTDSVRTKWIRSKTKQARSGGGLSTWGFERMTRREAIGRIKRLLKKTPTSATAQRLMGLFNIQAEELTEAGVSYETLKALEKHYPF